MIRIKMKSKFYLREDKVWSADDKNVKFVNLAEPEQTISYTSLHPDELEKFVEIVPNPENFNKDAPQEKLYRVITDVSTVIFLNEQSFKDISSNVLAYLMEIEEWERMCVVRDIGKYYLYHKNKKKTEIENFIRKHDKDRSAAKGES